MKHFITATILFLGIQGYSQTAIKFQPYSATSLQQFLWSFSKKSSKPNEKALIDFDVMDNWRGLGYHLAVSDDGKYFAYTINKMVYNDFRFGVLKLDSLIVQSTKDGRRMAF